ncbi:hypothetical protein AB4090_05255 [Acidithiobacillus sp. IBUN Pt1247-S3]|uniref:hypothetical protein n=1 Tax=Acidithiobacillus sp. IBUN Pt1247-S3 TaxID=3166642 RepID=UPI0034E5752E
MAKPVERSRSPKAMKAAETRRRNLVATLQLWISDEGITALPVDALTPISVAYGSYSRWAQERGSIPVKSVLSFWDALPDAVPGFRPQEFYRSGRVIRRSCNLKIVGNPALLRWFMHHR